jgi:hypothetical protein
MRNEELEMRNEKGNTEIQEYRMLNNESAISKSKGNGKIP